MFRVQGKVSAIELHPNLDLAEGVLDAVMQVIMCTVGFLIYGFAEQYCALQINSQDAGLFRAPDSAQLNLTQLN